MNPWTSLWLQPRQVIREIVDNRPRYLVLPLAIAAGASEVFSRVLFRENAAGVPGPLILLAALLLGGLLGLIGIYVFGWLYRWVGSWLGGQGSAEQVRTAIAWAGIPSLVGGILGLLAGAAGIRQGVGLGVLVIIWLILRIWQLIISCQMLGEVHRFSAWKGFGTLLIPGALLVVPLMAAIAIPNFVRARATANESMAIGSTRALISSLEMYRSVHDAYPATERWSDMYPPGAPAFGPAEFLAGSSLVDLERNGFRYSYQSAGGKTYQLRAIPSNPGTIGSKSFYTDESGKIYHCVASPEHAIADSQDIELGQEPQAC